jgi:hypothetical protein
MYKTVVLPVIHYGVMLGLLSVGKRIGFWGDCLVLKVGNLLHAAENCMMIVFIILTLHQMVLE